MQLLFFYSGNTWVKPKTPPMETPESVQLAFIVAWLMPWIVLSLPVAPLSSIVRPDVPCTQVPEKVFDFSGLLFESSRYRNVAVAVPSSARMRFPFKPKMERPSELITVGT